MTFCDDLSCVLGLRISERQPSLTCSLLDYAPAMEQKLCVVQLHAVRLFNETEAGYISQFSVPHSGYNNVSFQTDIMIIPNWGNKYVTVCGNAVFLCYTATGELPLEMYAIKNCFFPKFIT
jgi:hypothetical protein